MTHLVTIVYFLYLLRFQVLRRKFRPLKNAILLSRNRNILYEFRLRQQHGPNIRPFVYSKSILSYMDIITSHKHDNDIESQIDGIIERRIHLEQPTHLFDMIEPEDIPELRQPKPGLLVLPYRYFQKSPGLGYIESTERVLTNDSFSAEEPLDRKPETYSVDIDLSGHPPNPVILQIINEWFPDYRIHLGTYCRPHSFGPQAFYDFNRTTDKHPPPTPEREQQILDLMQECMNIKPYHPIHLAECLATGIPLSTSASYQAKYSPEEKVLSSISSPGNHMFPTSNYSERPTSKGHHVNSQLMRARQIIHNIKYDETPSRDALSDALQPDSAENARLQNFFLSEPTELFIRTQISKRDPNDPKKIRPVYAVSFLFILIELMLTYCLIIQLRNPECCVLHGLETFRGGLKMIDLVAHSFTSYISLDWSQFDQRLPLYVVICYFTQWIPRFLVINKGYAPTHTYPKTTHKSNFDSMALKLFNLLQFLLLWYINMVFISYDGYAYVRLNGGVPSGLYNTQSLDSFGNMYIILDCLLEFGFTLDECKNMIFFVLGDDNIIFARQNFTRICDFMVFLDTYANTRHGMILSVLKSTWTTLRNKIEVLGYTNNLGMPQRPIGKLVAQLAFPERPVKHDWMHAARALGLAYASCGQDSQFHFLCYMVYQRFKPTEPIPKHKLKAVFKYVLFEYLQLDDPEIDLFDFPDFPSLLDVRRQVDHYHGFFHQEDKWNKNVFSGPPTPDDPDCITLAQWLKTHPEYQFSTANVMHGYTNPL